MLVGKQEERHGQMIARRKRKGEKGVGAEETTNTLRTEERVVSNRVPPGRSSSSVKPAARFPFHTRR